MVVLPDVNCLQVSLAIRRMVTERLHADCIARLNHGSVVVATGCTDFDSLELVETSVGTVSAAQLARKCRVWCMGRLRRWGKGGFGGS